MAKGGIEGVERWLIESRPCREVYGGDCNIHVGPPKWSHRVNRYRDEVKVHPTMEQALVAARNPETPPDVLRALGDWDPERYGELRAAARANPNCPNE